VQTILGREVQMSKVFLAMFGGTPMRGELCLYLNAAAGLYKNCEGIQCYPIDKDTESPNYVNTRNLYNQYRAFREVVSGWEFEVASAEVTRTEDMFESMLKEAVSRDSRITEEESIQYLMAGDRNGISEQDQRILNICFTKAEQEEKMKGGYYGKANIGSVTGDILMYRGVYRTLNLYRDIKSSLSAGHELDVVVVCSSFGGTGASLGINFGEYLRNEFKGKDGLRIHCIYIQPYFSFPNPEEDDQWKIDCNMFYAKSATATIILGQKKGFIKEGTQDAIFDRFYYLGQESLDNISDKNSAMSNQDNRIHMVDMLVSLAIEDILTEREGAKLQLYGYQYSNGGTDILTWRNMPPDIRFKTKHVCLMRFCEFMLDCMEPLFADNYPDYSQDTLMMHLYGRKGNMFSKTADITEGVKIQLQNDMRKCLEFCRSYVKYWIELEETTKFGHGQSSVTRFFNLDELKRILAGSQEEYEDVRASADTRKITEVRGYSNYKSGKKCLAIYDGLCCDKRLKGIAKPGDTKTKVAKVLTMVIFDMCKVENYSSLQE